MYRYSQGVCQLLSISQLLHSIAAKLGNRTGSISSAPAIAAGIIGAVILQVIFSQSSFINNIFSTAPLNLSQWLSCLGAGLPMIAIVAERTDERHRRFS